MNLLLLLEMAASGGADVAVQTDRDQLSAEGLLAAAWGGAAVLRETVGDDASALAYVGTNGLAFPVGLFAAAAAGVPFVPLNYRLTVEQLHDLLVPLGDVLVVAEGPALVGLRGFGHRVIDADEFVERSRTSDAEAGVAPDEGDGVAVLLHTSGTTAAPKAAVLRHRNLTSYVIGTVEFSGAGPGDAALVTVPPYHVAGLANLLSNLYAGRRIVYLRQFDAGEWVATVGREAITQAMVVPTMLSRICDVLDAGDAGLPSLRSISYGGARTPATVLMRTMSLLPDVDFTNAYGLTETSSTIAVLGPDDHRAAREGDATAELRLASAGKVLPTVEIEVRDDDGTVLGADGIGEIWVRGEQVSGEYRGLGSSTDGEGWFPTKDRGWLDPEGYLFIEGRSDDTIIRGGENVAPAEIEEVLLRHPDILECAVVGVPDDEWGQCIAAAVVVRAGASLDAEVVRSFARESLRGSKTPDVVTFREALPYTETGKLLRRVVQADFVSSP